MKCTIWKIERNSNVLVAVLDDVYVGIDFLKTKPIDKISYYFAFCCE